MDKICVDGIYNKSTHTQNHNAQKRISEDSPMSLVWCG